MIVLDANILIRAVLGRRVRQLLDLYGPRRVGFFAPDTAFDEAERNLPVILEELGKSGAGLAASIEYLRDRIESIGPDIYCTFEQDARRRLRGRDEDDWPVLACALALGSPIWTEDPDFFGTGVAVWTTSRVEIFLEKQTQSTEQAEE